MLSRVGLWQVTCDAPIGQRIWAQGGATVAVCVLHGGREPTADECEASVTYYDPSALPTVERASPNRLPLGAAERIVTVSGANFAPTGAGLVCRFGEGEGGGAGTSTLASFVAGDRLRCAAPRAPAPRTDTLRVSLDGGASYSTSLVVFAHYDEASPPTLSAAWPPVSGLDEQATVTLTGANFAPTPVPPRHSDPGLSCRRSTPDPGFSCRPVAGARRQASSLAGRLPARADRRAFACRARVQGFSCRFGALPSVPATFEASGRARCAAPGTPPPGHSNAPVVLARRRGATHHRRVPVPLSDSPSRPCAAERARRVPVTR